MTDDDLVDELTRSTSTRHGAVIKAATIHWPHPGKPEIIWKPLGLTVADASAKVVPLYGVKPYRVPTWLLLAPFCVRRRS